MNGEAGLTFPPVRHPARRPDLESWWNMKSFIDLAVQIRDDANEAIQRTEADTVERYRAVEALPVSDLPAARARVVERDDHEDDRLLVQHRAEAMTRGSAHGRRLTMPSRTQSRSPIRPT